MIKDTDINLKNNLDYNKFIVYKPTTFIFSPSEDDYNLGFVYRYFVCKKNDSLITEVNLKNYNFVDKTFYFKTFCLWKITGVKNNIFQGKIKIEEGVEEYNKNQISLMKLSVKNIQKYLTNPLQYWRGY